MQQKRADEFLKSCEAKASAALRRGESLRAVLELICRSVESYAADAMIVSVLILDEDGKRLRHGAAPSLPSDYNAAVDGIEIGIKAGSCGTAAHCRHAIFVVDIESDPLWEDFRELAIPNGLRSCWSVPLTAGDGSLLGTLAMYHRAPRSPSNFERELITRAGTVVTNVLEFHRKLNSDRDAISA